jgi:hypothetical protein
MFTNLAAPRGRLDPIILFNEKSDLMTDTLKTYTTFLSQKSGRRAVIGGLNPSGWAKRPEGTIDTSPGFLERTATCIYFGDIVRFEFDAGVLSRVRIVTRNLKGPAKATWTSLKKRISELLLRPGVPDDLCSLGVRECEWEHGSVRIRAKLFEREWGSKAYVYLQRQAVASDSGTVSLEDLFVYDAA